MKKIITLALLLCSTAAFADGKQLLEGQCMECHTIDGMGGEKKSAPPMYAVWHHYRQAYTDKHSFVEAVTAWLTQPQKDKAVMMGAIQKFGLMDKLEIDAAQAHSVAEHLYEREFELPEWYLAHYNKKHGAKEHGYGDDKQAKKDEHQHGHQH